MSTAKRFTRVLVLAAALLLIFSSVAMASDWDVKYVYFERLDGNYYMVDYEEAWNQANKPSPNTNTKLYNTAVNGMREALLKGWEVYVVTKGGTMLDYSAAVDARQTIDDIQDWPAGSLDPAKTVIEYYLDHMGNVKERTPVPTTFTDGLTVEIFWADLAKSWVIDVMVDTSLGVFADATTIGEVQVKWQGAWRTATKLDTTNFVQRHRYLVPGTAGDKPVIGPADVRVFVDGWWHW